MTQPLPLLLVATALAATLAGCSSRAWYEGFRAQQRQACMEGPADQYADCLERANLSYDNYQRQREELRQPR